MRCACVDIGSNTTRLLVADVDGDSWREVLTQRAYTKVAKGRAKDGSIARDRIDHVLEVVPAQVRMARDVDSEDLVVVATEAVRAAPNRSEILDRLAEEIGFEVQLLSGSDEARLSFVGATKRIGVTLEGSVAVIDVGGGSTEIAVGTQEAGATWDATFRIGSGRLAEAYLESDPPSVHELENVRRHVGGAFEGLDVPPAEHALAVGGTATSLRRLVGAELAHETLERGIRILATTGVAEVARRFDLDEERVKLLPAGMLILEELSDLLGLPLQIGSGGLREGVILSRLLGQEVVA